MEFNRNTRISSLINENEETIQTIASINKNFLKLKNPILRKVLAPRVTVSDAAKVGGVEINFLINKLEEIGFIFESKIKKKPNDIINKLNNKNMSAVKNIKNLVSLDVRPTLDSGEDPFNIIMKAVKVLKDEETLKIINSFEPIPLIKKLQSKGYESWTERPVEGEVHTFFKMNTSKWVDDEIEKKVNNAPKNFDEQLAFYGDNIKVIDVRQLEMPEPMVTILKEIETLKKGHALYVDHKKIPQFLLPELEVRNFEILYKEIDCNHTILLIYKNDNA
ncbi:MAG: DUF2249 domain-containing protein [Flavobacteriaceae bacterium]|nr:DUF2249 domain-containing protein [Flavobacteriaceae bacterium]